MQELCRLLEKISAYFSYLESRRVETQEINCEKYVEMIEKISSTFVTSFEGLRNRRVDFRNFAHPFDLTVENIPDCFQLKIIESQENALSIIAIACFGPLR